MTPWATGIDRLARKRAPTADYLRRSAAQAHRRDQAAAQRARSEARVCEWLRSHPQSTAAQIADAIGMSVGNARDVLVRMLERGTVTGVKSASVPGRKYWSVA